jgi:hypothetical protein
MTKTHFPRSGGQQWVDSFYRQQEATTGNIFYVHSGGAAAGPGYSPETAFTTLDAAVAACTASQGDIVVVMPGHTETTTAIGIDIVGVKVIGLGVGRTRPAFTATTAATNLIDVSAASCHLENVRLVGAASGCTALVDIAAADFTMKDCILETGAAPTEVVTVPASSDRFVIDGCRFVGTAAGPNVAIDFEGEVDDWVIQNCTFNYSNSAGIDAACIRADAFAVPGGLIDNCRFISVLAPFIDFDSSDSISGDGMISNVVATIGPTTTLANIDTAIDQGGYCNVNVHVSQSVANAGSRIPVTTAD